MTACEALILDICCQLLLVDFSISRRKVKLTVLDSVAKVIPGQYMKRFEIQHVDFVITYIDLLPMYLFA